MSANVRTRVEKLIALATDAGSGEHESRNAALSAVKLIAEHKLLEERPAVQNGGANVTGFAAFLSSLPLERIMGNLNITALGGAAMEIVEMKNTIAQLERENGRLRAELVKHDFRSQPISNIGDIKIGRPRRRRRRPHP